MTVTADKAADVARRFGLSLTDARALSILADDEGHAERLAAKFATDDSPVEAAMAKREQASNDRQRAARERADAQADEHERRQAAWDALPLADQVARHLTGDTAGDAHEGDAR